MKTTGTCTLRCQVHLAKTTEMQSHTTVNQNDLNVLQSTINPLFMKVKMFSFFISMREAHLCKTQYSSPETAVSKTTIHLNQHLSKYFDQKLTIRTL